MDEKKYSQLYQALLQEVLQFHNGNQRRIRKGMLSLLLVPLVFLVLLFLSEGSRLIFLLLWIVSMFGNAAYLIAVEYIDYEMHNKLNSITKKEGELDQLTPLPSAMPQLLPMLRGRGQEPDLPPDPPQEEQESSAQSAAQAEEDLDQLLQGLRGAEAAPAAPEPAAQTPAAAPEPKGTEVTAPMVGVFYAAPAPGDEPFVHVGSKVKAGETLCIIEAMKVLNEVTAEADGEVLEICVADGDLVEFGSCLMRIG